MRNPWRKITVKYISFLLIVSIIPLLAIGITSYQTSSRVLQEEVSDFSQTLLNDQKEILEIQLKQLENLLANLSGVEEITNVLSDTDEEVDSFTQLATKARIGYILNGYLNLNGLVSIDVFSETDAHYHVGETLNVSEIRGSIKDQIKSQSIKSNRQIYWAGIIPNVNKSSRHEYVLTAARIIYKLDRESLQRKPNGLLLVNYSVEHLYNQFSKNSLTDQAALFLIDQKHSVIYAKDKKLIGKKASEELLEILSSSAQGLSTSFGESRYLVQKRLLPDFNWTLYSVIPRTVFDSKVRPIRDITQLILIIGFSIVGFAAWYFSRHVVNPLRQVIDSYKALQNNQYDLKKRLPVHSNDEIGELVMWFNQFLDNLLQREKAEEKIIRQAHFDSLTDLPNRFLSLDRLGQLLAEAKRDNELVAVFFLDLDDFKKVNDTLGHEVGDKLLIEAAARFKGLIRESDTVGRLGGDEFIVLLSGFKTIDEVRKIAENILSSFRQTFKVSGRDLILTISLGIAISPVDGEKASELLRNADTAMYNAKSLGRNTYSFFTTDMNKSATRRLSIEEHMHSALERNEFEVYYQPKISLVDRKIIGAEALLRWNSPELGAVSPVEFIPISEQTGLILSLGEFVLNEALQASAQWQKELGQAFYIAVNLSPRQFRAPDLVSTIEQALSRHGVAPESLEMEITEGVLLSGHGYINDALNALHDLGVSIALDDFGTGFASLNYLRSYPFDTLKIDRSFIIDMTSDSSSKELTYAAIAMSHALDLDVVAEGIETEEQLALLVTMGCGYGQGYLFGKPMPKKELTEKLSVPAQTSLLTQAAPV